MTLANIVVIVFIAVTLALLAGVEIRSRKRARRNEAIEVQQEREAA
jgi:uncharacterized membrane protein